MKHKEYVIINIERTAIDPYGVVRLIKANPIVDSMPELSAMFGNKICELRHDRMRRY